MALASHQRDDADPGRTPPDSDPDDDRSELLCTHVQ
jgi:hypothetical protein